MSNQIDLTVIDQMYAAQMSMNESEETLNALRPQVEAAVTELIRQRGLGKHWTGTLEYHGFKIVVSRPKSYTWEQNTQLHDEPNLAFLQAVTRVLRSVAGEPQRDPCGHETRG
ncbi:MAG: hypothetical protein IJS57_03135 [Paludibacteraceae bacterium]|nr:hypothetical protein [Paludibacteraceae bacterium]